MALTAQKSFASLMRKSYDRQTAVARAKFKLKKGQTEKILANYVNTGSQIALSELIKVLKEYSISDENYLVLIEDASSCVVLIGQDAIMSNFVDAVCAIEWVSRSEELVELFRQFVLHLVTAHSYHCHRVIVSLLKLLKADGENWDEIPPEETVKKWSYIHTILAEIVAVMPMTCDLLMQMVIEQYPYYKAGCYVNRSYIYNLIWMSKYIPSLQEQLITAVVNRMVTMDVNMTEKSKNKQSAEVFEMELDDDDDNDVSTTLDYCMWEVLRWLEDERDQALTIMCNVFEKVMLPTYGTKHVQFLLLYTISISQQCADRILTNLWIVAAGLHTLGPGALATRRTAASHLAGLLARCVRVPNTRLVKYLRSMADWCHSYITAAQESTTSSDNNKVHGAFHAISHAIFYLVAFKHKHLFSTRENMNFVESLNLPRLVTCALNPLRTCPPQVTRAFAAATRTHQVAYCQPIIEKNTRHVLHGSKINFDEWFPYDPYNLPVSGTIIWPLCIEYKDWLKDCSDETQYSGMKRKLDHEDDDFLMSASPSQKLAGSLSNCISPGFRTSESVVM